MYLFLRYIVPTVIQSTSSINEVATPNNDTSRSRYTRFTEPINICTPNKVDKNFDDFIETKVNNNDFGIFMPLLKLELIKFKNIYAIFVLIVLIILKFCLQIDKFYHIIFFSLSCLTFFSSIYLFANLFLKDMVQNELDLGRNKFQQLIISEFLSNISTITLPRLVLSENEKEKDIVNLTFFLITQTLYFYENKQKLIIQCFLALAIFIPITFLTKKIIYVGVILGLICLNFFCGKFFITIKTYGLKKGKTFMSFIYIFQKIDQTKRDLPIFAKMSGNFVISTELLNDLTNLSLSIAKDNDESLIENSFNWIKFLMKYCINLSIIFFVFSSGLITFTWNILRIILVKDSFPMAKDVELQMIHKAIKNKNSFFKNIPNKDLSNIFIEFLKEYYNSLSYDLSKPNDKEKFRNNDLLFLKIKKNQENLFRLNQEVSSQSLSQQFNMIKNSIFFDSNNLLFFYSPYQSDWVDSYGFMAEIYSDIKFRLLILLANYCGENNPYLKTLNELEEELITLEKSYGTGIYSSKLIITEWQRSQKWIQFKKNPIIDNSQKDPNNFDKSPLDLESCETFFNEPSGDLINYKELFEYINDPNVTKDQILSKNIPPKLYLYIDLIKEVFQGIKNLSYGDPNIDETSLNILKIIQYKNFFEYLRMLLSQNIKTKESDVLNAALTKEINRIKKIPLFSSFEILNEGDNKMLSNFNKSGFFSIVEHYIQMKIFNNKIIILQSNYDKIQTQNGFIKFLCLSGCFYGLGIFFLFFIFISTPYGNIFIDIFDSNERYLMFKQDLNQFYSLYANYYPRENLDLGFFVKLTGTIILKNFWFSYGSAESALIKNLTLLIGVNSRSNSKSDDIYVGPIDFYSEGNTLDPLTGKPMRIDPRKTGYMLSIIGESGSGKTTLIYLLTKLIGTDQQFFKRGLMALGVLGKDGKEYILDIDQIAPNAVRLSCIYLGQFIHIPTDLTIGQFILDERNVIFDKDTELKKNERYATNAERIILDFSLKFAEIHQKVYNLARNVDTTCNIQLSGGEKQRLALATVFRKMIYLLKYGNLINMFVVLDECTKGLDPLTSKKVVANLYAFILFFPEIFIIDIDHSGYFEQVSTMVIKVKKSLDFKTSNITILDKDKLEEENKGKKDLEFFKIIQMVLASSNWKLLLEFMRIFDEPMFPKNAIIANNILKTLQNKKRTKGVSNKTKIMRRTTKKTSGSNKNKRISIKKVQINKSKKLINKSKKPINKSKKPINKSKKPINKLKKQ